MIEKLKKVELHIHLDGSISLELASTLSGLSISDVKQKMIAKDKCKNLSEYLTKFDFSCSLMQTKDNLTLIAKDLVDRLAFQNVIYAEIRFAPMFHTKEGLTYEEIVESVLEGLRANKNIKTNLILCMMRGMSKEENLKTIEVASKYLNKGVVGIDLAGAEDKYPLDDYLNLFNMAKKKNIPFTIHAGENGSASEIEKAINIGATRIGHGIHSIESNKVLELIKKNNVLLEICPTSNVQTNTINNYQDHPIKKFHQQKIKVCINTDNTTVSNVSLTEEYLKLYNTFNFTLDDYKMMNINAINASFLSDEEKERLINIVLNNRI